MRCVCTASGIATQVRGSFGVLARTEPIKATVSSAKTAILTHGEGLCAQKNENSAQRTQTRGAAYARTYRSRTPSFRAKRGISNFRVVRFWRSFALLRMTASNDFAQRHTSSRKQVNLRAALHLLPRRCRVREREGAKRLCFVAGPYRNNSQDATKNTPRTAWFVGEPETIGRNNGMEREDHVSCAPRTRWICNARGERGASTAAKCRQRVGHAFSRVASDARDSDSRAFI